MLVENRKERTRSGLPAGWRFWSPSSPQFQKVAILAILVGIWELWVSVFDVEPFVFPAFHSVIGALIDGVMDGSIVRITWTTLSLVLQAYGLSIAVALLLTSFAISSSWGQEFLNTVTGIFQPLPSIALLPMAILWFGLSRQSLLFVVVMSMLWPLAASLTAGFAMGSRTLMRLGQNYELGAFRMFRHILLPGALPSLIAGLRVGWGFGWRTIVAAELVFGTTGTSAGLGYFINISRLNLNTSASMAGILVVIIIGLAAEAAFRALQRRTTVRWGTERS